jgi:hypothetical protein
MTGRVAAKDRRDLTNLGDEETAGAADQPHRPGAIQPTPAQRSALDELEDASVKAAERLNAECPTYQTLTLTPTRQIEAVERRLDTTLGAIKLLHPPLAKFYDSRSVTNRRRSRSQPGGTLLVY